MKPAVGERIELEVTKVVHGGLGLARYNGFVVFVRGALPRERVVAEVVDVKKNHSFAELIDVLTPSSMRVPHIWPEAEFTVPVNQRAGGADYGHIELGYQRALKTEILREALSRFGKVDPSLVGSVSVSAIPGDTDGLHWRTRVGLQINEGGQAGPFAEGTHNVVPVSSLPLAVDEIETLGIHTQDWSGHTRIRLVKPSGSEPRLILDDQKEETITEQAGGHDFQLSDQGFWQVHRLAADYLFSHVKTFAVESGAEPQRAHWDLYGGVGLFAKALLDAFGSDAAVTSVESDAKASAYAAKNLSGHTNSRAVPQDTLSFLRDQVGQPSDIGVVVIDPPRAGAKAEVVSLLVSAKPQAIIYVACDPVALSRDLELFAEKGYQPKSVTGVDMFPHTHHMEAIAVITPA